MDIKLAAAEKATDEEKAAKKGGSTSSRERDGKAEGREQGRHKARIREEQYHPHEKPCKACK